MHRNTEHPILIVGGGIAGLSTALRLADAGHRPAVITKTALSETASYNAQGGIAAVMGPEDSLSHHQSDTVQAGAGLCHSDVVRQVVGEGPECIRWLQGHGVRFTRKNGGSELHLTREGGHSQRRIVHAGRRHRAGGHGRVGPAGSPAPGDRIAGESLCRQSPDLASARPVGARSLRRSDPDRYGFRRGSRRVGPTWWCWPPAARRGSTGTPPPPPRGDGIAMAWRAGCRISNMEFVQFHPSCLHVPGSRGILISEALRGEGAPPAASRRHPVHDPPR